ncbi:MAG: hypothetical protein PHH51_03325 [Bacilli bacterium]|nr:hypothetical protein [Bacilli bacterium]MDD4407800.1 hypothetical protein [Bacilli bacterium]
MKKKYLLLSLLLLFITIGCTLGNTPKSKVSDLLKRYNNQDDVIKTELGDYLNALDLDDDNLTGYQDIYLRQYSDLKYNIKDERIDGDTATVEVEITVYDYYTAENEINNYISANQEEFYDDEDVYDPNKALKYRITELGKTNNTINYTLDFTLTKINNVWTVDTLTNEQLEKIHGTYSH